MTSRSLRVAVIGVGHLGRHHGRILATLPGVTLAGIVDIKESRAREVAAGLGVPCFTDAGAVISDVDAVTIAVPTESHREVALPFLDKGIPVLIEKPIARSLAEADDVIAAAAKSGAVLAVGHTERYNPAVTAAFRLATTPRFIEVHRLGAFPDRSLDIDVVFDLMIHDLDVILALLRALPVAIEAVGVPVLSDRVDIANARLKFESGCIANLTASRISRDRVRKLRFFQPDSYISVDYAEQELEAWRLRRRDGAPPVIEGGKLPIDRREPLKVELEDFLDAARNGRLPLVGGQDGRRALDLAERITAAMSPDGEH
ncbi:MAG: Gfo/Idh/MocA family oxidoreductase [Acidobacteria bacterium]|nr:Gfo/Idh/MocA family oxidoreductase [Acidobacteriota bacterium]